jgi:DNA/RNA endonuclease YhcR with UshA esterase domain
MKYGLIPAFVLCLMAGSLKAQTTEAERFAKPQSSKNISAQVGQKLAVCDTVYDFRVVNSTTTLLNLGGRYPQQKLTVTIKGDAVKVNPALMKGKPVCFYGEVTLFKNRPEMVVSAPEQIMDIKKYQ